MNGDVLFQSTENCLTMAAGSDPQPVESSVVPDCIKPVQTNSLKITAVRNHIPYSDHNYGKPLTPPNSCSPEHPEEADTGNEEEGFTRCICGFKHDDGYMICCDHCSAWQHVECVGIQSNSVPDTYLCDICDPRPLDKERAKQIQAKKREEPTDEDEEEDGDVSDHDSDGNNGGVLQKVVPLPSPASIKENILTKGKRKKRESTRKLGQKENKHSKRKRRKRKHISTESIPVDEETNGPWNLSPFGGCFSPEYYQEAHKTVYIGDLDKQSFPVSESQINLQNLIKPEQLCKVVEVQKNKKGVVVTEDTNGEQFLIECKGNLMLESKFKEDNPVLAKSFSCVLYYTKLDHLRLVMNLGAYGNDARFMRRSCSPTAEVRHVIVKNQIHLVVVSITPLAKGSEVTVAFEFPFDEHRRHLECACARDDCMVQKHNAALDSYERSNGYRPLKDEHGLSLMDSSLSNHMDSDSDGDNSNEGKDKRRKKLSREDRKLQAYLRQFEKMEKTEKKRQQSNGSRDARTGILTQRNFGDDYICDTPSKPGKGLRKQGLSQRHQRKMQANLRRTQRLPSCSSEPLSPEDNYSSAASTPTTPLVNVVEDHNEVHAHELNTPEKSFKFPKFKKGSLNDVSSTNGDLPHSNNVSPEALEDTSPSKSLFDSRLVDVEMTEPSPTNCSERLSNLEHTINGSASPRTDPNASPSHSHSTLASPTRSESVDLSDMTSRHCSVSPTTTSFASFLLSEKEHNSYSQLHKTLKKRWLSKYMSECAIVDREPDNEIISTDSLKQNEPVKISFSQQRTFPLPYKRRKLLEYVNSQTLLTTKPAESQTLNNTVEVPVVSISPTLVIPIMSNSVTSVTTSDVQDNLFSQNCSPVLRHIAECEEGSSGRSSLSSISSTDDIKAESTFSETRRDGQSNVTVDSSTGSVAKPLSSNRLSSSSQDGEDITNCLTQSDEVSTAKDSGSHIGSTVEASGHSTVSSGGKKKVSLSEYRKRASSSCVKKDSCPGRSIDVSSPSQSRVVENAGSLSSSTDPMSSSIVVNYRATSSVYPTLSSSVSSSTGGALIEPVSPDDGYSVEEDRPALNTSRQDLRITPAVVTEAKPSVVRESYFNSSLSRSLRVVSEPGSSSDAMDIEEDEVPSSSTILVNTPVMSHPRSTPGVSSTKPYSPLGKFNDVSSAQLTIVRQMNDSLVSSDSLRRRPSVVPSPQIPNPSLSGLSRHQDFHSSSTRPTPFH